MGKLEGKVALVTGAGRGIGRAIAEQLMEEGAYTFLVARRGEALRKLAKLSQAKGHRAEALRADISRERDVKNLFLAVRERAKRLHILVNNAGVFTYKPFLKTTFADWRKNIETNLTGTFLCTRAAVPLMGPGPGHVVNILSVAGREAFAKCSAYCASKFGARGLTKVLAEELRPRGIRVTGILPGQVDTSMLKEFDFPIRRERVLRPEDVARAVLEVLTQPERACLEEIVLRPSSGSF